MSETNAAPSTSESQSAEPVVLSGGESPASWDDLDRLSVKSTKQEKDEPKQAKEPKKKETEPKVEAKDQPKEKEKQTKGVEKTETPVKLLKLKSGETELDVASDAMVPVKIDGKVVEIPLQEALNRYSQQSHLDKLYKSYKSERETFDKERTAISDALNKSYDYLVNQKDLRGFMDFLGEAMGVNANDLYQDAVGKIREQMEEYQTLSPEERKFREVEAENAYYRKRMDAQKQSQEQAKSKQALESHVQKVLAENKMEMSQFADTFDEIVKLGREPSTITPEIVADYATSMRKLDVINKLVIETNHPLSENQEALTQFWEDVVQVKLPDELIPEALELARKEKEKSAYKKLNDKIDKNLKANRQYGSKAQKNPSSDPLLFDDLT